MKILYFIFTPLIIFFLNEYLKKKKIIFNYSGDVHQKFIGAKKIPLTGGFFLILFLSLILITNFFNLFIFLLLIFFIGFSSDIKLISSPLKRLILQTAVIICFVYFFDLYIDSTRIIIIDNLLNNFFFSIFFTSFCLIILMNGSNFIDGLNGLVLGYYIIVFLILFKLGLIQYSILGQFEFIYLFYLLLILLCFNFLNKFYLGDSGTYSLSFLIGFFLIDIYNQNLSFSPFFIVMLLWYPCFENLFSIIRKFKFKKSPISPDNNHLHQLIFFALQKKFKLKKNLTNNYSSIIISFYNLAIFWIASLNIYSTQYLIILILLNIIVYIIFYIELFEYKYKLR